MPRPSKAATRSGLHVALIRGINVGTAKRVAMSDLRRQIERLGYTEVRTLLNSGNVVFRGPSVAGAAARIEQSMKTRLGVPARVVVLTGAELAAIVKENALIAHATQPSRLMVAVAIDGGVSRLKKLLEEDWSPDALALGKRAAYLWCPDGLTKSRLAQALLRAHGEALTVRNWATLTKLHALANPPGSRRSVSRGSPES